MSRKYKLIRPEHYAESILLLLLSLSYFIGTFSLNLWSDDYAALSDNRFNSIHMLRDARPISAIILFFTFELVKFNLIFIVFFKFLGFAGLYILGRFLARLLHNDTDRQWVTFLIVAVGLTLPSFQVQVHWLHMWLTPWLSVLSLYSYKAWCKPSNKSKSVAVALLSIVFLSYPPMAFWIFSFGALLYINKRLELKVQVKLMCGQMLFTLFSYLISAAFSILVLHFLDMDLNDRVKFVTPHALLTKIEWFLTRPITTAFRPFMIDSPSPLFAVATAAPFIAFLGHYLYKTLWRSVGSLNEKFLTSILFLIWLLILPAAHLLVTSNNQYEFRMVPSLNFSIVYLLGIHFFRLAKKYYLFSAIVLILLPTTSVALTNLRFQELMNKPFVSKMNFFQSEFKKCNKEQVHGGFVIFLPKGPFPHLERLGDFSIISDLEYSWVPKGSLMYFLRLNQIASKVTYEMSSFQNSPFCRIDLELYRNDVMLKYNLHTR